MLYCPLPEGTYRVTQKWGERPQYYKKYNLAGHNGIDLAPTIRGRTGVIVFAPHEGYVTLGDEGKTGYGRYVEILSLPYNQKGERRKSILAHLDRFIVQEGQYIASGDPIGIMGNTGDSTNVHLHWTFKKTDENGNTLDKNNGFHGALNIGRYTLLWRRLTLP